MVDGAPEVTYGGSVLVLDGGFDAWRDFALTPPEVLGADTTQQEREAWAFRSGLHAAMTGFKQAPPPPPAAPAAVPKKKKGGGCS